MNHPDPYLRGNGDTRYRVTHYDLVLNYKVSTNRLDETARLHVRIVEPTSRIHVDLRGLQVSSVRVDGKLVKHRRKDGGFSVDVDKRDIGDEFVLEVRVSGKPRPVPGVHGEAGWEELSDGAMVGSQPQGAPSWFPCNNDAADKATYRIEILTDANYHVVANGTLASHTRVAGSARWIYEMTTPMSPYLATVQIGSYVEEERAASVPVSIVHPPRLRADVGTAFEYQHTMVDFFSEVFGPYPFAEYRAVVVDDRLEIPLEAQGLSSFGRNFIPATWENERLVAHELAHQWFGNAVTSRFLHDIWLHEGFACYSEWLWSDRRRAWTNSPTVQEQAAIHHAGLSDLAKGVTLADPGVKVMFDDWVYKRGALTLHALRAVVGTERFFEMLRSWVAAHKGATVTTEDFIAHCRGAAGEQADLMEATLREWLYEAALPALPVVVG